MTTDDIITAVLEWVRDTLPEIQEGSAYPAITATKTGAMPDVMAELDEQAVVREHRDFPWSALQQVWVIRRVVSLSFMVANDDPIAAATVLRDFADRLLGSAMETGTLGGRVPFTSPTIVFDFTRPFVEYNDGTRGREMSCKLVIGEPINPPEG